MRVWPLQAASLPFVVVTGGAGPSGEENVSRDHIPRFWSHHSQSDTPDPV
jgi:hypothetical protein